MQSIENWVCYIRHMIYIYIQVYDINGTSDSSKTEHSSRSLKRKPQKNEKVIINV